MCATPLPACLPACLPIARPPVVQEERMRELHEEGRGRVDCFEMIAEELAAGFSANQVCMGTWG
jgi:hypothetical protein